MFIETMDGSIVDLVVSDPASTDPAKMTLEEKWQELVLKVSLHNANEFKHDEDKYQTGDWRNGYECALGWVEQQMQELEEK